jgi:hypothetical protein
MAKLGATRTFFVTHWHHLERKLVFTPHRHREHSAAPGRNQKTKSDKIREQGAKASRFTLRLFSAASAVKLTAFAAFGCRFAGPVASMISYCPIKNELRNSGI